AEVVAKVVAIAKELGREIATPKEARKILDIKYRP
ncbi:3-keto-5-aminohexanoate cleavage protein, partial [Candidatus Bathyarchaeota archaeon]